MTIFFSASNYFKRKIPLCIFIQTHIYINVDKILGYPDLIKYKTKPSLDKRLNLFYSGTKRIPEYLFLVLLVSFKLFNRYKISGE